jgi:anti-sigma-K factor RskA
MKPADNSNWQQRLQELEVEVNQTAPATEVKFTLPEPLKAITDPAQYQNLIDRLLPWFNNLSQISKVVVAVAGALVAFVVLRSVLQLVAAAASLAILGIILYLVYRFWIAPKPTDQ